MASRINPESQCGDPQFLRIVSETNKHLAMLFGLGERDKSGKDRPPVKVIWFGESDSPTLPK